LTAIIHTAHQPTVLAAPFDILGSFAVFVVILFITTQPAAVAARAA
jgi:hypothetical protein